MTIKEILKVFLFFIVSFALVLILVFCGFAEKAVDSVRSGVVSDKNVVEEDSFFFIHQYAGYRIYIDFEYEFCGVIFEGNKYFVVDKDTYLSYDIGDYFDIRNF